MADYYITQNDTYPPISGACADENENPIDLTGASVRFHMRNKETKELVVNSAALIDVASEGSVAYVFEAGDTATAGMFLAEFEVTYEDGGVETFPTDELEIYIRPEVN